MSQSVLLQCMCWGVGVGGEIRDGSECVVTMHVLVGGGGNKRWVRVCCYNACVVCRGGREGEMSQCVTTMHVLGAGGVDRSVCVVTVHVLGGGGGGENK